MENKKNGNKHFYNLQNKLIMIIFNWTISAVDRAVSLDGLQDVIQTIHWRYKGTDENGTQAETYGATSVGSPNPQDFTPFNGVTTSDVEGWLIDILGKVPTVTEGEEPKKSQLVQMQEDIENQIALLITPTTITSPLYSASV